MEWSVTGCRLRSWHRSVSEQLLDVQAFRAALGELRWLPVAALREEIEPPR